MSETSSSRIHEDDQDDDDDDDEDEHEDDFDNKKPKKKWRWFTALQTQPPAEEEITWHFNALAEANIFDRPLTLPKRTGFATMSAVRATGGYLRSACRLMLKVLLGILIISCLVAIYLSLNRQQSSPSTQVTTEIAEAGSPLYQLLKAKGLTSDDLDKDNPLLEKISRSSYVEYKSLIISETVFPLEEKNRLVGYVQEQLLQEQVQGNELLSPVHVSRILSMVEHLPESSVLVSLDNGKASLRNTAVVALLRVHLGKIYFGMSAAVLEAHLGFWGWIPCKERSAWNRGLSQMVEYIAKDHLTKDLTPRLPSAGAQVFQGFSKRLDDESLENSNLVSGDSVTASDTGSCSASKPCDEVHVV